MKKYILLLALFLTVPIFSQSWTELGGKHYGTTGSVSTSTDTLSIAIGLDNNLTDSFKNWFSFSVVADDTIQISDNTSFNAGTTIIVLPDIPFTSQKYSLKYLNELYIARYGTDGTPNYFIAVEGN